MNRLSKYLRIWLVTTKASFASQLKTRISAFFFIFAKTLRFAFNLWVLFLVLGRVQQVAGFDFAQLLVFYLVFNLIDTLTQLFFRGIYFFNWIVRSGNFDFYLVKPISPLFRILTNSTDILDVIEIIIMLIISGFLLNAHHIFFTLENALYCLLFVVLGIIIATAIHIIVAAIAVIFVEISNTIMLWRDLSRMAQVPIDIYHPAARFLLTLIIPVAVVFNYPARALLGQAGRIHWLTAFILAACFLFFSLKFWRFALRKYTSASS